MDEIAICGVSARIAKCRNLKEFAMALLAGEDLVTYEHDRWNCDFLNTPKAIGVLSDLENFDAGFFGINPKQADQLDPRTRQLLEVVFESIIDAGYNPQDLRGTNTAVILAVAENSNEGLMDRSLAIMANTISYYLDIKGPSYALDTGCSSSVYALNQAVEAISFGSCENVVVCSAQTHLLPTDSIQLNKLGVLSKEGKCKAFDDERDGYVKSEAVISIFLQKRNKAKRIYATIAGIGCNVDGFKQEGMSNPSSQSQISLFQRIYDRFTLDPNDVEYIDAHGTGTLIGDIKECTALAGFFTSRERSRPLKIGSVKTNAGHCENAAGLVSLVKLIIVINTGIIPATIHFNAAPLDIPSIDNKILEVVKSNTQYDGGLLALNCFGIGGANGHLVIRPYVKNNILCTDLKKPRLIFVSARTEESLINLLDTVVENKENLGFLTLFDSVFEKPIKNYHYKGFSLFKNSTRETQKCSSSHRPIWFSYSGMGSQWPGMAKDLMNFQIFKNTIHKCSRVLEPYGIDLKNIIVNGTDAAFEDPEICFPAIIAVSVGLTDILYSLGIRPEGIIGHSLGEIGCAYGDGLTTLEQAILMARVRGLATKKTKLIPGLMASVGLTLEDSNKILPDDIYVACHNYEHNITISGPKESVTIFVEDLKSKGVFAKIVNTAGIAFHSKYIHDAGPFLLEMLKEIIPEPIRRSAKWLSSAIPECEYQSYLGRYNSAEYHYHNFMNRVYYEQVLKKVPEDAVLIEIAPSGLFQAIFRRALNQSITKLCLVNKDINNNVEFFLTAIGKIYLFTKVSLNLNALNETSPLPLDGKAPFISPLIQWDHSSKWHIPKYVHNNYQGEKIVFDLRQREFKFLYGYLINGKAVFPSTGFLFLAWKAFVNKYQQNLEQCSVTLQNVQIFKIPELKDTLEFYINILQSGDFEIVEDETVVATGNISLLQEPVCSVSEDFKDSKEKIDAIDIYKELHLRGFDCNESLRGIQHLNISGDSGAIKWLKNWIPFMDCIVQSIILHQYSELVVPTQFLHVKIDSNEQQKLVDQKKEVLKYNYVKVTKTAVCGGVQIKGLIGRKIKQRPKLQIPILNHYEFISNELKYQGQLNSHLEFSLSIALQIVIENNTKSLTTYIAQLVDDEKNLKDTVFSLVHPKYIKNVKFSLIESLDEIESNINLLILLQEQNWLLEDISKLTKHKLFIFCKTEKTVLNDLDDKVVFRCSTENVDYVLLRKYVETSKKIDIVETSTQDFNWIEILKENLSKKNLVTYLVSYTLVTGLIAFFNCLKEELQARNLRIFIFNNAIIKKFNPNSSLYQSQIRKDLTVNILKNNKWCTYRMLPLECSFNKQIDNCYLQIKDIKLKWVETSPYMKNHFATVQYACLNHWDRLKYQKHNLNKDNCQEWALEFSGINQKGENIIGISRNGCLRTSVEPDICWVLSDNVNISLEEAATIPLDYTVAYYSLNIKGKIQTSDNILISGTDSTCLAAIFFALDRGCAAFIDIKNPNEIATIKNIFHENPKLHFVSLYDQCFLKDIMLQSKGEGINVIFSNNEKNINSRYTEILAKNSKLITVYQNNTEIDRHVSDAFTLKQCQIYRIQLTTILTQDVFISNTIHYSIQNYLNKNAVIPFKYISGSVFDSSKKIMDYLNSDSDKKLVVSIDKGFVGSKNIKRKIYFDPCKSYLVIGGLEGVGLELIKWLIKKGATKIVLNSRNSNTSGYAKYLVEKWTLKSKTVLTNNVDATTIEGATAILKEASSFAPIGGIFNLTMVINDNLISDLSPKGFFEVVAPILCISQNMDQLSQKLCPDLQYFVIFSAMTALGNQGQANYGFANSSIEMMCSERKNKGLPALAVQWGCIGDVGFVARQNFRTNLLTESPQNIYFCLKTLENLLLQDFTVVSSATYDSRKKEVDRVDLKDSVLSQIAVILGAKSEKCLEKSVQLVNLGIDSISTLEIKNIIQDELGVEVCAREIRKMTLEQIKRL